MWGYSRNRPKNDAFHPILHLELYLLHFVQNLDLDWFGDLEGGPKGGCATTTTICFWFFRDREL